jgi:hypothetical protein
MLLLAWAYAVGFLTGYTVGLFVPAVERRKRSRGAELHDNGHHGARALPPVAQPDYLDPRAH